MRLPPGACDARKASVRGGARRKNPGKREQEVPPWSEIRATRPITSTSWNVLCAALARRTSRLGPAPLGGNRLAIRAFRAGDRRALDKGEEIGIDAVLVRRAHAVRGALVDHELRVLHDFRGE